MKSRPIEAFCAESSIHFDAHELEPHRDAIRLKAGLLRFETYAFLRLDGRRNADISDNFGEGFHTTQSEAFFRVCKVLSPVR